MFLIYCEKDNSHCKVNNFEVKFDEENIPTPGELVSFYSNTKEFQGKVIMYTDDKNAIDMKLKELTKTNDKSRRNKSDSIIVTPEKPTTRKRGVTPEKNNISNASDSKKAKKSTGNKVFKNLGKNPGDSDQTSQKYIQRFLIDKESTRKISKNQKIAKSLTKQQLKQKLQQMQGELDAVQGKSRIKKESISFARGKNDGKKRDSSPITESPIDSDKSSEDTDDDSVKSLLEKSNKKKTIDASKIFIHEQEIEDDPLLAPKEDDEVDSKSDEDNNKCKDADKPLRNSEGDEKDEIKLDEAAEFYDEDVQLLGPKHNMKMVDIGKGIYCTEYRWKLAESSREGTIMIRHLLEGVFKHDKILNCTFTGQDPRNKPKTNEIIRPLHTKATSCIINLVLKRAEDNKWKKKTKHGFVSYTWETLQQAMTQRLVEIKRAYSQNSKLQPKSGC